MSRPLPGFLKKQKEGEALSPQYPLLRFTGTIVYVQESGHCQRLCLGLLRHLNPTRLPELPPLSKDEAGPSIDSNGDETAAASPLPPVIQPESEQATSMLGFDIEWKVVWQKGAAPRPTALLQVNSQLLEVF